MKALNERLSSTRARLVPGESGSSSCSPLPGSWSSSPQRSKVGDLKQSVEAAQTELVTRQQALARPSADVKVRASDTYRLTKALPDGADMAGVILDVNRVAKAHSLTFTSIAPAAAVARYRLQRPAPHRCRAGPLQQRLGIPRGPARARARPRRARSTPAAVCTRSRPSTSARPTTQSSRSSRRPSPLSRSRSAARPRPPTQARPRPLPVLQRDGRSRSDSLMAKTQKIDPAAAKARKQKIMLGVVGAVLVVLAAIQGPKLMKQLPAAPPRRLQRHRPTRLQVPRLLRQVLRRRPEPLPQSRRYSPARP